MQRMMRKKKKTMIVMVVVVKMRMITMLLDWKPTVATKTKSMALRLPLCRHINHAR